MGCLRQQNQNNPITIGVPFYGADTTVGACHLPTSRRNVREGLCRLGKDWTYYSGHHWFYDNAADTAAANPGASRLDLLDADQVDGHQFYDERESWYNGMRPNGFPQERHGAKGSESVCHFCCDPAVEGQWCNRKALDGVVHTDPNNSDFKYSTGAGAWRTAVTSDLSTAVRADNEALQYANTPAMSSWLTSSPWLSTMRYHGQFGFQAEHLAKWVHEQTGHTVSVYRPPNHSSTGFALIFGLSILAVLYVKWDVIGDLCTKDNVSWLLIAACLAFISGQVWNTIRTPQYLMRARGGGIGFIYPSTQNQLVAETHIVLVLYGLMTGGVIMMAKGGEKLDNLGKQRSIMVTGACMLAIGYGLMLNVFKRKYQGYPYSFFLG